MHNVCAASRSVFVSLSPINFGLRPDRTKEHHREGVKSMAPYPVCNDMLASPRPSGGSEFDPRPHICAKSATSPAKAMSKNYHDERLAHVCAPILAFLGESHIRERGAQV